MSTKKFNIVYLHPADIGRYVEPYGYPVATPHMQRIAERGVTFRNAYCTTPSCSPARASLLTGQYPVQHGMISLTHQGCLLNDYRKVMVHTLRDAGYTTVLAGHQHIHPRLSQYTEDGREITPGEAIGYDIDLDMDDNHADQRVREFLQKDHPTPFFLDVGFMQTHRPFPDPTPEERPERCRPMPHLPDTPQTRRDQAMFNRAANAVDLKVGYVLQALEESGHADDTIIVLTTDHGEPFFEAKAFTSDMGLGVMLVLAGGPFRGNQVVDGIVSQIDIFPTLCDVIGIDRPDWLEGTSLVPLVRGEAEQVNEAVFGELNYHGGYRPSRTVRTPRFRYIRNWYDRRDYALGPDAEPAVRAMVEHGWRDGGQIAREELYDHMTDPLERVNLAEDPRFAEVKADLADRLERWMQRIDDPLLSGKIDPPEFYSPKGGRSKQEREAHLGQLFKRPGTYVSQWTGDPYVRRQQHD